MIDKRFTSVNGIRLFASLRDEQGAAAVEFAIVALLLFMILFGILEYGRIYSELEVFESAAREGARVAAVRGDAAAIANAVKAAAQPYTLTSTPTADHPCTTETIGQSVKVSWTQHFQVNVALLPPLNKDISIAGVFRCE